MLLNICIAFPEHTFSTAFFEDCVCVYKWGYIRKFVEKFGTKKSETKYILVIRTFLMFFSRLCVCVCVWLLLIITKLCIMNEQIRVYHPGFTHRKMRFREVTPFTWWCTGAYSFLGLENSWKPYLRQKELQGLQHWFLKWKVGKRCFWRKSILFIIITMKNIHFNNKIMVPILQIANNKQQDVGVKSLDFWDQGDWSFPSQNSAILNPFDLFHLLISHH